MEAAHAPHQPATKEQVSLAQDERTSHLAAHGTPRE
jgi:hypothetical protein